MTIEGRPSRSTFWGKAWCDNLESYSDFANRLPRGRTYVRNGRSCTWRSSRARSRPIVSGSELYTVEITITACPKPTGSASKEQCAGKIGSLVELLQGKLSKSVMDVVTRIGVRGSFPSRQRSR